jgi:hypothetical protein
MAGSIWDEASNFFMTYSWGSVLGSKRMDLFLSLAWDVRAEEPNVSFNSVSI